MSFTRLIPWESRATDEVAALLMNYPAEQRALGLMVGQLKTDYPNRLKDGRSLIQCVNLLAEEGFLRVERSWTDADVLESLTVYPWHITEIPPSEEYFDHTEEHGDGHRAVHIHFYKNIHEEYVVWPFVRRNGVSTSSFRHFQVLRAFPDVAAAREAALTIGRTLIEIGWDRAKSHVLYGG
jgi:hypothetical protein